MKNILMVSFQNRVRDTVVVYSNSNELNSDSTLT